MVTVNTTYIVPTAADGAFRMWARKHRLPEIASTEGCTNAVLSKVMVETEPGTSNYSIRFDAETVDAADKALAAPSLSSLPPAVLHFTSLMEWIAGTK